MSMLTDLHEVIASTAETLGPAVVRVGRGSGIVVADGYVLTNAHNVHDEVHVTTATGERLAATIHAVDLVGDLAVVAVPSEGIEPVTLADTRPSLGQPVVALARSRDRGLVATPGTVSAVDTRFRGPGGRVVTDAFEHTAPLPRGASGGPVVDVEGRVLGIDTHRRRDGFYAAVAAPAVAEQLAHLLAGEVPVRPRLGVAVAPSHVAARLRAAVGLDARDGVLVREVESGGAADRAGIRPGDLVVGIDDGDVANPEDLQAALVGSSHRVRVVRGAEELTIEVDLTTA